MDGLTTVCTHNPFQDLTQSCSGRGTCMYNNSATPSLACIGDTCSPTPCLHMVSSRCLWLTEPNGSETSHSWSRSLLRLFGTGHSCCQCLRQKAVFRREVSRITGDGDDVIIDCCGLFLIFHGGRYSFPTTHVQNGHGWFSCSSRYTEPSFI